jgi:hypothetical protein
MNISPTGTVTPCRSRLSLRGKFWLWYCAGLAGSMLGLHWYFS